MYVLSIESSCDETSIAILQGDKKDKIDVQELSNYLSSFSIVSSVVSSQIEVHRKFGGVVPEISARNHAENIHYVLNSVLEKANLNLDFLKNIDYIFVTTEPGLVSALRVGLEFAKTLQFFIQKKYGKTVQINKVNHLRGHVASCFYSRGEFISPAPSTEFTSPEPSTEFISPAPSTPLATQAPLDRGIETQDLPLPRGQFRQKLGVLLPHGQSSPSSEGLINQKDESPTPPSPLVKGVKVEDFGGLTPIFPHLHLLVSGGNSQILLFKSWHEWEIVGQTLDDAAGECLDKAGRMLGLPYPGGVHISKISGLNDENFCNFPISMIKSESLDYSFSGLKTAVRYFIQKQKSLEFEKPLTQEDMDILMNTLLASQAPLDRGTGENNPTPPSPLVKGVKVEDFGGLKLQLIKNICISVQSVVVSQLMNKITLGVQRYSPVSLGLSGGVSANPLLRQKMQTLASKNDLKLLLPQMSLTGDNAVMIALSGLSDILKNDK